MSYRPAVQSIIHAIETVIVGKEDVIAKSLTALLAGGHVLLEDVPGVGKTMLVRTFSRAIDLEFKRVQFTPDMLPSDLTGISMYNQKTKEFEYRPGPLMGNIVLADEINRTSPKTQSALLEAMAERSVTVDGEVKILPSPFFVMATQNPIEHEGTYPLPEAQLDRFLLKIEMGYPSFNEEVALLTRFENAEPLETLQSVVTKQEVELMQREVKQVHVSSAVKQYIVRLIHETRKDANTYLGGSPRATLALMKASQAWAYIHGRDFVLPDDVKALATSVLGHRILLTAEARYKGRTADQLVKGWLDELPVPMDREVKEV
ncbi:MULTISPECIES: AAA family ATPase [Exiguobacterium]|uniref:Regulatory ATPase RavA n=1 Tax=Exiguobacterium aurantiacum TaxID=33987 RepID=A0A377FWK4_9BACL|nr:MULTISPECIES: MoxR family ATPase [Exiguobacterium]STO09191.1 regulatory ATPase RavA [Exiguobacterium aurantiacum]